MCGDAGAGRIRDMYWENTRGRQNMTEESHACTEGLLLNPDPVIGLTQLHIPLNCFLKDSRILKCIPLYVLALWWQCCPSGRQGNNEGQPIIIQSSPQML